MKLPIDKKLRVKSLNKVPKMPILEIYLTLKQIYVMTS